MTSLSTKKRISPLIVLFALFFISFVLFSAGCSKSEKVIPAFSTGLEASPTPFVSQKEAMPALPFELTNQFGQTISLAQLKDKVVVLTFLYTNCPDVCPLIISHVQQVMTELSSHTDDVALVVITVDPERDTVERLQEYTASLAFDWQYLTGGPEQVKAVWANYGIYVEKQEERAIAEDQNHSGHQGYEVKHTTVVILIDKEGLQRSILLGLHWQVAELEEKLWKLLLDEK